MILGLGFGVSFVFTSIGEDGELLAGYIAYEGQPIVYEGQQIIYI